MTKTSLLLLLCFIFTISKGQKSIDSSSAKVAVSVTNTKGKPQKGEEVLFISSNTKKTFSYRTDAAGNCLAKLLAGDTYTIKLKTLTDTSQYSSLEIPALQPGHFYSAPFSVEIEFEPPRSFTLNNVHFDTNKPTLRPESFKELNEIASYMKWKDEETFEIAGHTDDVGNSAENMKLSQARAETVKKYLITKGVNTKRLSAKGYGATKPIADNGTEEGRQLNRRTEVIIL